MAAMIAVIIFSKIKQCSFNPAIQQARMLTSKISGTGGIDVGMFTKRAGHNTAWVKRDAES